MQTPDHLKYTKEHEWVLVEGDEVTIGITDYAQDQLGDIVMVEFPDEGQDFQQEDVLGVVESVKSVSDIFAPLSGEVTDVNTALVDNAGVVNQDCYGEGWLVKMKVEKTSELEELMTSEDYQKHLQDV